LEDSHVEPQSHRRGARGSAGAAHGRAADHVDARLVEYARGIVNFFFRPELAELVFEPNHEPAIEPELQLATELKLEFAANTERERSEFVQLEQFQLADAEFDGNAEHQQL
jgi:hypothetical protein